MEVPFYEGGGENFYEAKIICEEIYQSQHRRFQVELKSIDSLFTELQKITFIKCDVEGHEFSVVEGAKGLINKSKPAWMIEITTNPDDPSSNSYKLFDYFAKQGYTAYWFDGKELMKRARGDRSVNYFFLTLQHLALVKMSGMNIRPPAA
jgi:hypothetical protein